MSFEEQNHPAHLILCLWADRMREWSPRIGYPQRTPGLSPGGRVSSDDTFDSMCDAIDARIGRIVEAIIDGLEPHYGVALQARYLGVGWRFQRLDINAVLAEAMDKVWAKAIAAGIAQRWAA